MHRRDIITFLVFISSCAIICSGERVSLLARLPRSLVRVSVDLDTKSVVQQSILFSGFSEELVVFLAHDANASTALFTLSTTNTHRNQLRTVSLSGPLNPKEISRIGGILEETITTFAYDWVNKLVYVGIGTGSADSSARIEVCSISGIPNKCTVIIYKDLDFLRYLVLDPTDGYMYWINEIRNQIERAFMNGDHHDKHPFQDPDPSSNISPTISSLNLHHQTRSLYYVRSPNGVSEIWRCKLYERNSCTQVAQSHRIMFLTVTLHHLMWTTEGQSVVMCLAGDCERTKSTIQGLTGVEIMLSLSSDTQPIKRDPNPCLEDNGGCSDFCLSVHFEPWSRCACRKGVLADADNKTCSPNGEDKILFIASSSGLFYISLDTPDHTPQQIMYQGYEQESPMHKLFDVDWDPIMKKVYWIDATARKIRRANFDGSNTEDVITNEISSSTKALRIDPYAQTIYWLDSEINKIQVSRTDGSARRSIVSGGMQKPQGLALDPLRGYLYFSDWTLENSRIERVRLDGTDRQVLVKLPDHSWPNGIDIDEEKIYWTESNHSLIKSSKLDGSHVAVFAEASGKLLHPYSIAKLGDRLYCNSMSMRSFLEIRIDEGSVTGHALPRLTDQVIFGPLGIRSVSLGSNTTHRKSLCSKKNGGCSHICVMTPEKTNACLCPLGYELQSNRKTCLKPNSFLLAATEDAITRLSMTSTTHKEDIGIRRDDEPIIAMDIDQKEGMAYYAQASDLNGFITRIRLNGTKTETILSGPSMSGLSGIVIDSFSKNIYWSSLLLSRIEVCDSSGRYRRILAFGSIRPSLLTAHLASRTLFYYNNVMKPSIMRMSFTGERDGGKSIISGLIGTVTGLAVDITNGLLYWSETNGNIARLSVSKLDGSSPELLFVGDNREPKIHYHFGFKLWWTDAKTESVGFYERKKFIFVHKIVPNIKSLLVVHGTAPSGNSFCSIRNGDCPHLCLESTNGRSCKCVDHYTISAKNQCIPPDHIMFIASNERFVRLKLERKADRSVDWVQEPAVVSGISNVGLPRSIAFDPISVYRLLFWVDKRQPKVLKIAADSVGTKTDQLSLHHYNCTNIYSVAIDDLGRQLFVSCANRLNVSSVMVFRIQDNEVPSHDGFLRYLGRVVDGSEVSTITSHNPHPTSIAIFPTSNYLFYVDSPSAHRPSIIQCEIDGRNCRIWLNKEVSSATNLHADVANLKLLYTSSSGVWSRDLVLPTSNVKKHYDRIGSRQSIVSAAPYESGLLVAENDVITDTQREGAQHLPLVGTITAMHTKFRGAERSSLDSCSRSDCSHLCRFDREADLRYNCLCPMSMAVSRENPHSCIQRVKCLPWQFICEDGRSCIHRAARCDKIRDCPDGSDESPVTCRNVLEDRWPCEDGNGSIPKTSFCNGRPECVDGSDERNCRCSENELDCGAWPRSGYDTQCLRRKRLCDGFADCDSGLDENQAICALIENHPPVTQGSPEWIYVSLMGLVLLILLIVLAFCCFRQNPSTAVPSTSIDSQPIYRYNGGAEASILLPASTEGGGTQHFEVALRTYSIVDSSSSYHMLPPPNSHYDASSRSSSSRYGRRPPDIPINRFYAPPPSAASLSTYGVVKPAGMRPVDTGTSSKRRRRARTASRGRDSRTPPPQYSQLDNLEQCEPIVVDPLGSIQPFADDSRSMRAIHSQSSTMRTVHRSTRGQPIAPSNSRIVSSESGSTPTAIPLRSSSSSSLSSHESD